MSGRLKDVSPEDSERLDFEWQQMGMHSCHGPVAGVRDCASNEVTQILHPPFIEHLVMLPPSPHWSTTATARVRAPSSAISATSGDNNITLVGSPQNLKSLFKPDYNSDSKPRVGSHQLRVIDNKELYRSHLSNQASKA
ncbi:hypothetical protein Clacol_004712 [Clathrus columnatus]|uniref:Uncharacterized protein n=1 Tax=Clathrus columnatus TaxID=1419009 RepID=A0AAV5A782_9AGAM|nr:hypothetical protein Clacol_004712 [Clathrus columnatus]